MTRYGLELVRDFAEIERWSAEEIRARSKRLGNARRDLARLAADGRSVVVGNWKMNTTLDERAPERCAWS